MRLVRQVSVACSIAIAATHAYACKCSDVTPGNSAWEKATHRQEAANAIFEGTPERFVVQWNRSSPRPGDLMNADSSTPFSAKDWPRMIVTMRVKRIYKGDLGSEVQLFTGLGGGDCGAQFATGLDYLVYAYGPSLGHLEVNICTPGGWLGSNYIAADLRYLRKERPIPSDVARLGGWTPEKLAQYEKDREEFAQRYATVTGQICGVVSAEGANGQQDGSIAFLSAAGYSPYGSNDAQVGWDGKFCSNRLGPGRYYLYYMWFASNDGRTSAMYFPALPIAPRQGRWRSVRERFVPISLSRSRDKRPTQFGAWSPPTISQECLITESP